jgi:hypothetical protein
MAPAVAPEFSGGGENLSVAEAEEVAVEKDTAGTVAAPLAAARKKERVRKPKSKRKI